MEQTNKKRKVSRRNFIETSITGGAAVALGLAAGNVLNTMNHETVKMLTPDGQLVEVEKRLLPKTKTPAVSNKELLAWMETTKK